MISHKKNTEILVLLHEIAKVVNNNLELNNVFESVYDVLKEYLGLDGICLWLWSKENERFKLIFSKDERVKEIFIDKFNLNGSISSQLLKGDLSFIYVNDDLVDINNLNNAPLEIIPQKTKLFLPLFDKENFLGIVGFIHPKQINNFLTSDNLIIFTIVSIEIYFKTIFLPHIVMMSIEYIIISCHKQVNVIIIPHNPPK